MEALTKFDRGDPCLPEKIIHQGESIREYYIQTTRRRWTTNCPLYISMRQNRMPDISPERDQSWRGGDARGQSHLALCATATQGGLVKYLTTSCLLILSFPKYRNWTPQMHEQSNLLDHAFNIEDDNQKMKTSPWQDQLNCTIELTVVCNYKTLQLTQ